MGKLVWHQRHNRGYTRVRKPDFSQVTATPAGWSRCARVWGSHCAREIQGAERYFCTGGQLGSLSWETTLASCFSLVVVLVSPPASSNYVKLIDIKTPAGVKLLSYYGDAKQSFFKSSSLKCPTPKLVCGRTCSMKNEQGENYENKNSKRNNQDIPPACLNFEDTDPALPGWDAAQTILRDTRGKYVWKL